MKENALSGTQRFAWTLGLCLCFAASPEAKAQSPALGAPQGSNPGSGKSLAEGIRHYRRGDFELAAQAFQHAEKGAGTLSRQDQQVLRDYSDRAGRALVARNQARMELAEAETFVKGGQVDKARSLLARVTANRFISPQDLERVNSLESQLTNPQKESTWSKLNPFSRKRPTNPSPAAASTPMPAPSSIKQVAATQSVPKAPPSASSAVEGDARQLLAEGRRFFQKRLVDQAHQFAMAASEAKVAWDPAGDSPKKLLAEIEAYRVKHPSARPASNKPGKMPITEASTQPTGNRRSAALALLMEGRDHLDKGDFKAAEEIAVKVFSMNVGLSPTDGDSPEQLWNDIKRKKSAGPTASTPTPTVPKEASPKASLAPPVTSKDEPKALPQLPNSEPKSEPRIEAKTPSAATRSSSEVPAVAGFPQEGGSSTPDKYRPVSDKKADAAKLISQAREALTKGDHLNAVKLARQAEQMGVKYDPREDSPEKIFEAHAAVRARMEQRRAAKETAAKGQRARELMAMANAAMEQGDYVTSSKMAKTALALDAVFGTDELTPSEMLVEIERRAAEKELAQAASEPEMRFDPAVRAVDHETPGVDNEFPEAVQPAVGEKPGAVIRTAGPGQAAGLLDAAINALGRGDYSQADAYLRDAATRADSLNELQKQQLQELAAECQARIAKGGSEPGRRSISDTTKFSSLQEPAPPAPGEQPRADVNPDELEQARQRQAILLQKLRQDVIEAIEQASLQLRDNPDRAIETLRTSLDAVKASGLDPDKTANLVSRLEAQIRQYQRARQEYIVERLQQDQQDAARDARQRNLQTEIQKQNTIKQLSNRYNALMDEGNFREAEAVAMQIIEIDPNEPFGVAGLYRAQLSGRWARIEDVEWRKQAGFWNTLQAAEDSAIPIPDDTPMIFPDAKTWEEISTKREKYKAVTLEKKTEATREIESALTRPVSFEFRDTPLKDVIEFIQDYTGVNVVLDANGLDIAGVSEDEPITLSLNQVPLRSALRLLLDPLELTHLIRDDVLLITDKEETAAAAVTLVYPVADLVLPIQNFGTGGFGVSGGGGGLGGGGLGGGGGGGLGGFGGGVGGGGGGGGFGGGGGGFGGGGGGFGGGGGGFGGGGGGGGGVGEDISEEVIELIQNTVEPDEWEENGGTATIEYFQPNRSFVVTAPQKVHDSLADLFDQLRRLQDLQIVVEVRFITVSESFFERIGVDFDVSFDNNNDEYIIQEQNQQTNPNGVLTPIVDNNGLGVFDGNHVRGVTVGRDPTGVRTSNYNIPLSQSSFAAATVPALAGLGATNLGGTNFGIAFLNDIDVFLLLEAVQGDQRSNTLQAPKVTLFNGQTANVRVTDQVPFVTDVTPVISAGAVTFDPTVETIQDGTTVSVQAVVSADRRFVRLTVVPLLQTVQPLEDVRTVAVGGTAGGITLGGGIGGLAGSATATIQLPIVSQVTVLTTVSVPDGGTVLLGGLKTHREARNEFGTPVLSKVPYVNRLFKNAATARVTDSLMLLVSPRIIILEEEEEKLGVPTSTTSSIR